MNHAPADDAALGSARADSPEIHRRAARAAEVLLSAAQALGAWVSPDLRLGIDDCARVIGMAPRGFKKRLPETGLRVYRVGGGGHKRTIRIFDLALWLESQSDVGDAVTDTLTTPHAP